MSPARPNLLLITATGLRRDTLPAEGISAISMPNIEAIAAHGMRFASAETPSFAPALARAAILWGRSDLGGAGDLSLPQLLRESGYHTAVTGSLGQALGEEHAAFDAVVRAEPLNSPAGDDDYHRWLANQGHEDRPGIWAAQGAAAPVLFRQSLGAVRSNLPESAHVTTWIGNQAVRFVQTAPQPFFLWVSFPRPGFPFDPPAPWDEMYDRSEISVPEAILEEARAHDESLTAARLRKVWAFYAGGASQLDHQVGRLLATLTSRGRTNNLLAVSSTHGCPLGEAGQLDAGEGAGAGARAIPLIVAGVQGQRRGAVDEAPASLQDLYATLLEAAGIVSTLPESRSLLPRLLSAE